MTEHETLRTKLTLDAARAEMRCAEIALAEAKIDQAEAVAAVQARQARRLARLGALAGAALRTELADEDVRTEARAEIERLEQARREAALCARQAADRAHEAKHAFAAAHYAHAEAEGWASVADSAAQREAAR